MKILVVSDTHQEAKGLQMLQENFFEEIDVKIHCGDSELPADAPCLSGFTVVQGNCDIPGTFPEEVLLEAGGMKIFVSHGHQYRVKQTVLPISYKAKELGAQIVCFGHSHFLGIEEREGVLFINPGSLNFPRGRAEGTYVIIDVKENEIKMFVCNEHQERIYRKTYSR